MAISDNTIAQLQQAVKTEVITDLKGTTYSTRPLHVLPIQKEPQPSPIAVNTLAGFAEFVLQNVELGRYIHVVDPTEVRFLSELYGPSRQRDTLCVARAEDLFSGAFRFNQYCDQADFMIALQTLFVPDDCRGMLTKIVGTIKGEEVRESTDDGVTQMVSARAGSVLVREVPLPNPIPLRPYRTFREVEQPESLFVLRAQYMKGQAPLLGLFDADGGAWKLTAIRSIADYLEKYHVWEEKNIVVLA